MAEPPFVMSKYLTKEALYKEKAKYYQNKLINNPVLTFEQFKELQEENLYCEYREDRIDYTSDGVSFEDFLEKAYNNYLIRLSKRIEGLKSL